MKKLFFSLVALMVATMSFAQSNLVATLSHNGEVTVFHGSNSLIQAMNAADHGDIITLASGQYNAVNITKAITLRGAGIDTNDTNTGTARTQIIGDLRIDIRIPDTISKHLIIEGIYHNNGIALITIPQNSIFQKSRFNTIEGSTIALINSLTFINCNITGRISLPYNTPSSAKFINCVVKEPQSSSWNYGGDLEFTNCVILGSIDRVYKSYFQNCILNVSDILHDTNMATYCAGYTSASTGNPFTSLSTQSTNKVLTQEQLDVIFKDGTFYELTDEAKAEYVGIDDKEIGIYGGNLPFETRILSPQITKCNVAAKTTADGKLSVDIEVKAAE